MPDDHATPPPASPTPPFTPRFIVEPLFPANEIHLWGGEPGSGVTTLLCQSMQQWSEGRPVFGGKSNPGKFCYVACEKSRNSTRMTLDRIGTSDIPLIAMVNERQEEKASFESVLELCREKQPGCEVVCMDGITSLIPGNINYYEVISKFFAGVLRALERYNLTLFAIMSTTKGKEGERFLHHRHRFIGAAASGNRSASTVIVDFDPQGELTSRKRVVHVLASNSPARILHYDVDDRGRFVLSAEDMDNQDDFELCLFAHGEGATLRWLDIAQICNDVSISISTGRRYIRDLISQNRVRNPKHDTYIIARTQ